MPPKPVPITAARPDHPSVEALLASVRRREITGSDREALLARCTALRREPRLRELRECLLAAAFAAVRGPIEMGLGSQRNYARDRLDMLPSRFSQCVRVGELLWFSANAREALVKDELRFRVLERLATRLPVPVADALIPSLHGASVAEVDALLKQAEEEQARAAEAGREGDAAGDADGERGSGGAPAGIPGPDARDGDPGFTTLAMRPPAPVATLIAENLRLARTLAGGECHEADAHELWIAEAFNELPDLLAVDDPGDKLPLRKPRSRRSSKRRRAPGLGDRAAVRAELRRRLPTRGNPRRLCARLDRALVKASRARRRARADLEDALLRLHREGAARTLGYLREEEFAAEELGLPRRSFHDHLRRARARLLDDPVAVALAAGRIGSFSADQLRRLSRMAHVPAGRLAPWIELASSVSTRELVRRIDFAIERARHDTRRFALEGWPVPTENELRACERPLVELLNEPAVPTRLSLLAARPVRVEMLLREAVAELFLQMWAGLHKLRSQGDILESPWVSLLLIVLRGRLGLAAHDDPAQRPRRLDIYLRLDGHCSVPVCWILNMLDSHHIHPLGQGGPDTPENQCPLCRGHHQHGVHEGRLRIIGRGDEPLRVELALDEHGQPGLVFVGEERVAA